MIIDSESHDHAVLGVVFKLASVALLAGMAAAVKYLGQSIPVGEIIFVRGLIGVLVLALVSQLSLGVQVLKTSAFRSHAARSIAGTVSMFCWFTALALIPLAEMTAISFTTPMYLTLLAMLFLGERIRIYRWMALAIGFAGVLIMIGPLLDFENGSAIGVMTAVAAAFFGAFAQMSLRRMSGGEHALTITFYFLLTSMICAAVTVIFGWIMPTGEQLLILLLVGLLGVFGQLTMSFSYRYAEASTIAPLDYTSLLMAVGYGFLFFGEIPGASIWLGAPLVILAGMIILWREFRQLRDSRALRHRANI